jgi:hypothetical protein
MHGANIFSASEVKEGLYSKTYRFGYRDQYNSIYNSREDLFFTKPELNIIKYGELGINGESDGVPTGHDLNPELATIPFWIDLKNNHPDVIRMLEGAYDNQNLDNFNHLLQNQVISNLDIPGLSSEMIDTPTNVNGVGYSYRGTSEASDDNPEFSLEFRDTRWLDTYYFFKAYEEYETLKHHGLITPYSGFAENKILYDAFSIYKFLVDEDMETILYYGKMYGVVPKSLPRDVFSSPNFDNGLSYSIDFKAAFYEDMRPEIISDFNNLSYPYYSKLKYQIGTYNYNLDRMDMRPAQSAFIVQEKVDRSTHPSSTPYVYKLKWRGSDLI